MSITIDTTKITRTDRSKFDSYSRHFTTAFDLDETQTETKDGKTIRNHRFEVTTSHWPERKAYRTSINRMTHDVPLDGGFESTLLRNMMTGEPCPIPPQLTSTPRFNKAAMHAQHEQFVSSLLAHGEDLARVIAWTLRETENED